MTTIYDCEYHHHITGFGSPNGTYTCSQPLIFNQNRKQGIKFRFSSISNTICNVFKTSTFNNGLLRVSNDNGATYTTIQLKNGKYTVNDINLAIQDIITSWYIDSNEPAFQLLQNEVIQKVYCIIDSTKLTSGAQFIIDFSLSEIKTLLGCSTTPIFNSDGTHEFDAYPQMEWTGARINVNIIGIPFPLSYVNGISSSQIASISKNGNTQELISDNLDYSIVYGRLPDRFYGFDVEFVGSNDRRPIYLLEGEAICHIQLIEF